MLDLSTLRLVDTFHDLGIGRGSEKDTKAFWIIWSSLRCERGRIVTRERTCNILSIHRWGMDRVARTWHLNSFHLSSRSMEIEWSFPGLSRHLVLGQPRLMVCELVAWLSGSRMWCCLERRILVASTTDRLRPSDEDSGGEEVYNIGREICLLCRCLRSTLKAPCRASLLRALGILHCPDGWHDLDEVFLFLVLPVSNVIAYWP